MRSVVVRVEVREPSPRLGELASAFLRLGLTAFGGPAAHIAMMENEFVSRRRWLTREDFLDLVGAASLIPGPSSSEVAIYIGQKMRGWLGLLIAGVCFILPAALIVSGIAWAYGRYGQLPKAVGVLYGIKPVIIAIVVQALWVLGQSAIKNRFLASLCITAIILNAAGVGVITVLFGAGIISALAKASAGRNKPSAVTLLVSVVSLSSARLYAAEATTAAVGLGRLFLVFLKVGAVQFGSGYVLLAFLRSDLVSRLHWMTEGQLLDAIAVGQFTPGPVFTTATFIGWVTCGPWGALIATIGIFLPAFILVSVSGPLIPRIRRSQIAGAFLDGVNVATVALMVVVSWFLGKATFVDVPTVVIAIVSFGCLVSFQINSAWLVLVGGLLGILIS